jgi:hypothetical protein
VSARPRSSNNNHIIQAPHASAQTVTFTKSINPKHLNIDSLQSNGICSR